MSTPWTTPATLTAVLNTSTRSSASRRWRRAPAWTAGRCGSWRRCSGSRRPRSCGRALRSASDYELTHSCYDPDPDGRPCGRCDSCRLRARGFDEAGVADPAGPAGGILRDRASLLHRPVPDRVRRADHQRRGARRPPGRRARSDRVLSDLRRPAVRHRPAWWRGVVDVVDRDDGTILHVVEGELRRGTGPRADRLGAALRAHAAAHGAARALRGVRPGRRRADRELSPRRRVVHDRSRPDRVGCRHRARRGRSEPDRLGRPARRDPLRRRRRSGEASAAQGARPDGPAAADRGGGLRHFRVRRHARGAHRRDRHDCRRRIRARARRNPRGVPLRRAGAARLPGAAGRDGVERPPPVRSSPAISRPASSGCRGM